MGRFSSGGFTFGEEVGPAARSPDSEDFLFPGPSEAAFKQRTKSVTSLTESLLAISLDLHFLEFTKADKEDKGLAKLTTL